MAKPVQKNTPRVNLNLLYPQGIAQKLPIRFLRWLLSYGRFIVVAVEIFVLAAFAFRFKLDADLTNLKEQINEKVPFIESLSADEARIKQTQQRLAIIKNVYAFSGSWQGILSKISAQIPITAKLTSINSEKNDSGVLQFKLNAQTTNISDVALLLKGLREDKELKDINLSNISFEQGYILFSITGSIK
ncbi:hypothetical protein HYW46_00610 [Candidatus Daviesbacteria bacterium]|nr:hypothetical protein [Candidatus Daviesbacteria bacterium]